MNNTIEIFRTHEVKQPWRWRLRAKNGQIIANGAEGYSRKPRMLRSIEKALSLSEPISGNVALTKLTAINVRDLSKQNSPT